MEGKYCITRLVTLLFCFSFLQEIYCSGTEPQIEMRCDSVMKNLRQYASLYAKKTQEYKADLYVKAHIRIEKQNFIFRHIPSMFQPVKGIKDYILETFSDVHYTTPNIYNQKIKNISGTLPDERGIPGLVDYFNITPYASTLVGNNLLSPLAANSSTYYAFRLDSIRSGYQQHTLYYITFTPKNKSTQLVSGNLVVTGKLWTINEMRFRGSSEMLTFDCTMKMGQTETDTMYLPVEYEIIAHYRFLGNRLIGKYKSYLNYRSIHLNRKEEKAGKKNYNLTASFSLKCNKNAYSRNASVFDTLRPIALSVEEKQIYQTSDLHKKKNKLSGVSWHKKQFWGSVGDFILQDYKWNFANSGTLRSSPFMNPLMFSYSASNGIAYRQDFRYNTLLAGERLLQIRTRLGYNFKHTEFYWDLQSDFTYYPQKNGKIKLRVGNGNRIYSSDILNEIKNIPDSIFNFDLINLDYFNNLVFKAEHSIEVVNGLTVDIGFSAHKRTPVKKPQLISNEKKIPPDQIPDIENKIKTRYVSFAPRIRLEWTPGLYYYMNSKRKMNLRSLYPTFILDYERGIKNIFKSTGEYERFEFDMQHHIKLGLMRNLYYRAGMGIFTNQKETYFVDFENFKRNNLPTGWSDDIGGVFQLLDRRWYNASRGYIRAHAVYEAPFLLLRHLIKHTSKVQNERIYLNVLNMPHLNPYIEGGYGIGTHIFDLGLFVSIQNWQYSGFGCKFTFELFN